MAWGAGLGAGFFVGRLRRLPPCASGLQVAVGCPGRELLDAPDFAAFAAWLCVCVGACAACRLRGCLVACAQDEAAEFVACQIDVFCVDIKRGQGIGVLRLLDVGVDLLNAGGL